jgi:hypothetical protein
MHLRSNNCELIANEAMNLVCLKFKGGNYFFKHQILDSVQDLVNCEDIDEIRDLLNDYKEMLLDEMLDDED